MDRTFEQDTWTGPLLWTNMYSFVMHTLQCGLAGPFIALKLSNDGSSSLLSGVLISIVWGAVIVFGGITPGIIRRIGVLAAHAGALCLTLIGFVCLVFVEHIAVYILGSAALGIALSLRWISCDFLVIQLSSESRIGRNVGLHETLMGGSIAIGPLMLGLAQFGYSIMFAGVAAALLLAGGLLKHSVRSWQRVSRSAQSDTPPRSRPIEKKTVSRALEWVLPSVFIGGFIEAAFIAFLPTLITSQGYSVAAGGFAGFIFGLGGTLLQPFLGMATRYTRTSSVQRACIVLILLSLAGAMLCIHSSYSLISPGFLALVFFAGGWVGGTYTLAAIDCGLRLPAASIDLGIAKLATFYTAGAVVGPLIVGGLASVIGHSALIYSSAGLAVGLCVFLFATPSKSTFSESSI